MNDASHFEVIDPGHEYLVKGIDGAPDQRVSFVKREGDNYPGNSGAHGGPLTQGFLGVCLDRAEYMNSQGPCAETDMIIYGLRIAIMGFEVRAARCRGTSIELVTLEGIQDQPTCAKCGHIQCDPARHDQAHWSEGKGAPDSRLTATKASSRNGIAAMTTNPRLLANVKCHMCNDTGMIAIRSRDGQYAFAGPVPDDAKGYADADCWYCDSALPLPELPEVAP